MKVTFRGKVFKVGINLSSNSGGKKYKAVKEWKDDRPWGN